MPNGALGEERRRPGRCCHRREASGGPDTGWHPDRWRLVSRGVAAHRLGQRPPPVPVRRDAPDQGVARVPSLRRHRHPPTGRSRPKRQPGGQSSGRPAGSSEKVPIRRQATLDAVPVVVVTAQSVSPKTLLTPYSVSGRAWRIRQPILRLNARRKADRMIGRGEHHPAHTGPPGRLEQLERSPSMLESRMTGQGASVGCPARWTTASTPAIARSSAARSVSSPTTCAPAERSKVRSDQPSAGSRSRSAVPIRPWAPVIRTVIAVAAVPRSRTGSAARGISPAGHRPATRRPCLRPAPLRGSAARRSCRRPGW